MAKRKKKKVHNLDSVPQSPMGPSERRINIGVEEVENGFVIRASGEGLSKDKPYESKTFIAPNHDGAVRIATTHMQRLGKKAKGKKAKRKVATTKR